MREVPWWLRRTLHTAEAKATPQAKGFERVHDLERAIALSGGLEPEHIPSVAFGVPAPHLPAHGAARAWLPLGASRGDAIVEALEEAAAPPPAQNVSTHQHTRARDKMP